MRKQIENTPESNALEQSHSFNQSLKNTPKVYMIPKPVVVTARDTKAMIQP